MSSDFLFRKWRYLLTQIEKILEIDTDYQTTKTTDKSRCDAVQRLAGVLGEYMSIFKKAIECQQNNQQLQKAKFIDDIVNALADRILELKHQLKKLVPSVWQYLHQGLIAHKITSYDADLYELPALTLREKDIDKKLKEIFQQAVSKKEAILYIEQEEKEKALNELVSEKMSNWWIEENEMSVENIGQFASGYEVEEKISYESSQRIAMINLIKSHEKTRQIIFTKTQRIQRRILWQKELMGLSNPPAREEIREKASKLIQNVMREYFRLKRKIIEDCKRDNILGIRLCDKITPNQQIYLNETKNKAKEFNEEIMEIRELMNSNTKQNYLTKYSGEMQEHYRDAIRNWFEEWYKEVIFFYDIPKEGQGGLAKIFNEETPTPAEWLDQYKSYIEQEKSNKNKSAAQLKLEKKELAEEKKRANSQKAKKKRAEAALLKKAMKNPSLHPGFCYPISKKVDNIKKVLQNYRHNWDTLDMADTKDVKIKWVKNIEKGDAIYEVNLDILKSVDDQMRKELKMLKKALKKDYDTSGETMPVKIKIKKKKNKNKRNERYEITETVAIMMEDLYLKGILQNYPHTDINDFVGDFNFVGDDLRCQNKSVEAYAGETRTVWWERCMDAVKGNQQILLVGPSGSGKTTLVNALATKLDAYLYCLDPDELQLVSTENLHQIITSLITCSKATQPSLIHLKDMQKIFVKKQVTENIEIVELLKKLKTKMFKKINKNDKITVIGTCSEPWTAKKKMLKKFPTIVLMPSTTYSVVSLMLKDWVLSNQTVPRNLDITSLARMLRGYKYTYLLESLKTFLTADRIIKIAAHGLSPMEIFDYVSKNESENKVDYEKYLKWYYTKTPMGKKENKFMAQEKQFQIATEQWRDKNMKKKKTVK